jgi:hypothetical protein
MWMSAIELSYVNIGHRAVAFRRYSKPPRAEEVLPKFLINSIIFLSFFCREQLVEAEPEYVDRLPWCCGSACTASHRHCTDSPRLCYPDSTDTLGITPFLIIVIARVTWFGVSRSKDIPLLVCRSLHIYDRIYFGLSTYFGQPVDA